MQSRSSIASQRQRTARRPVQIKLLVACLFLLAERATAFTSRLDLERLADRRKARSIRGCSTKSSNTDASPPLQATSADTVSPHLSAAVASFVAKVQLALEVTIDSHVASQERHESFVSLSLIGRSKKDVKEQVLKHQEEGESSLQLRGTLRTLDARFIIAGDSTLTLQVTFKYHLATDIVKNWPLDTTAHRLQAILLLKDMDDEHLPHVSNEWESLTDDQPPSVGSAWGIQFALLETNQWTYRQEFTKPFKSSKKNATSKMLQQTTFVQQQHDRVKQGPLLNLLTAQQVDGNTRSYLQSLGLVAPDGKPRPKQASKLKQCNKIVEIVSGLIDEHQQQQQQQLQRRSKRENDEMSRRTQRISIIDMGCGRGYLTFSLHDYLTTKMRKQSDLNAIIVQTKGVDIRPKLVTECNNIARQLGSEFDGLMFQQATIESFCDAESGSASGLNVFEWTMLHSPTVSDGMASDPNEEADKTSTSIPSQDNDPLKILMALHACDTATDDALWAGIRHGADIIVVAPCCHKQLRPQINQLARNIAKQHQSIEMHHLADVLRHPIYRERMAETVTDSLRALLLEHAGYSVQVFEFIGGEHTSKNCMITAVRQSTKRNSYANNEWLSESKRANASSNRIQQLASFHGVAAHKLAEHMGMPLGDAAEKNIVSAAPLSARNMPPMK
ncbi:hypothetical protein MPSEU_000152600 [Mayamaea pseudoterrestris]|nr:hypothetical protein MPSEU_000152600 [Mayamaea pseudoterrestris]